MDRRFDPLEPVRRTRGPVLLVLPTRSWWALSFVGEAALQILEWGDRPVSILSVPGIFGRAAERYQVNRQDRWRPLLFRDPEREFRQVLESAGAIFLDYNRGGGSAQGTVEVKSREALEQWTYLDLPVGFAVSAAISGTRRERYYSLEKNAKTIRLMMAESMRIVDILEDAVTTESPGCIVTTNDRVLPSALAHLVGQQHQIPSFTVYWGSDSERFAVYRSSLYSAESQRAMIDAQYPRGVFGGPAWEELEQRASELVARGTTATAQFRESMTRGLVPGRRRPKRFVFFPQTPWEFSGVMGRGRPGEQFVDQIEAVQALVQILPADEWEIVVRHHPTRADLFDHSEAVAWEVIRSYPNVTEIEARCGVDSYELAESATLCGVWVSTIGLELALSGRPVCVFSSVYWLDEDSGAYTRNVRELRSFLAEPSVAIPAREDLVRSVSFLFDRGAPFDFVSQSDGGTLLGGVQLINRRLPRRIHDAGARCWRALVSARNSVIRWVRYRLARHSLGT